MKLLGGKTALVTGGARGIGKGISARLAGSGALVAINYAGKEQAARETLAEIEAVGGQGFLLQARLGSRDAAYKLAERLKMELMARTGETGLDILVNNVGGGPTATVESATEELYERTINANMGSTFWVTQSVLPLLRDGGRIINISSAASRLALEDWAVYSMAKAGIDNFTRSTAKYLGPRGITVNSVVPGLIATPGAVYTLSNDERTSAMAAQTALGKAWGEVEDVAGVVHALASPAMGWVTGQLIEVSGGFKM
jgi:NAD(P)-dependent dehydrogenase (short-subunit alcohol dehydrogenase family)